MCISLNKPAFAWLSFTLEFFPAWGQAPLLASLSRRLTQDPGRGRPLKPHVSFNVASWPPFHPLRSTSVPSTLKMPLSRVTSAVSGFILLGCPHSLVLMTALSFRKPLFPQGSLYIIPILSILVLILPHQMPSPHSLPQTFRGNWHYRERLIWVFFISSLIPLKYLCLSSKTRALNNLPQTT